MNPIALREVITQELGDELLVYDLARHRAHSLNAASARVWRACDGTRNVRAIAAAVGQAAGSLPDDAMIRLALDQLARARLLAGWPPAGKARIAISRRELVRRIGKAAAVAVPLVISITAPKAVAAASCGRGGASCTKNNQCCTNRCQLGKCSAV